MSWTQGGVSRSGVGGCLVDPTVDQAGGQSIGPADREHPVGPPGLAGDLAAYSCRDNPVVE